MIKNRIFEPKTWSVFCNYLHLLFQPSWFCLWSNSRVLVTIAKNFNRSLSLCWQALLDTTKDCWEKISLTWNDGNNEHRQDDKWSKIAKTSLLHKQSVPRVLRYLVALGVSPFPIGPKKKIELNFFGNFYYFLKNQTSKCPFSWYFPLCFFCA